MDIKDFILIGGGILIAAVVGHGFWIAWRTKREPLRLDIVPDLIPDDVDDMERLRGELPNGGARVINKRRGDAGDAPAQVSLDLDVPVLTEADQDLLDSQADGLPDEDAAPVCQTRAKPRVHQAPPRQRTAYPAEEQTGLEIRDVSLTEASNEPLSDRIIAEPVARRDSQGRQPEQSSGSRYGGNREVEAAAPEVKAVEELLVLNLIAAKGERYDGAELVDALRKQGLRYGEMNIFHRVDPATKAKLYSVANIIEPGTFDLSDLDELSSPGMTFFLQLPGPDDALGAFEDMLTTARNVALDLGGDVRDEQMSFLTRQGAEHMRQRIADYARRRLSKRA